MTFSQTVCIQGLGFVGAAMAVAAARAGVRQQGCPIYRVIGLDQDTPTGRERVDAINAGRFPFATTDRNLSAEMTAASAQGNLNATCDPAVLAQADVIVVDVHFDIGDLAARPRLRLEPFRAAIRTIGVYAKPGTLVVIETTVPPGTCSKVVRPLLDECLRKRGLQDGCLQLAHAYERVMPGDRYLASITDFWRVYAADDKAAADACERFLSSVISVADFPLTRLSSTLASETAKVLENSYRAVNIAFMDEWGKFAERVGVDMFEIAEAIRVRPTHSNIRLPGFGVGGYCLTKDPLFAELAARDLFGATNVDFPFCRQAVGVNRRMPLHSLEKIRTALGGLGGRKVLLAGISYRQDVADTRFSPSETFYTAALEEGAQLLCFDPLLDAWDEVGATVARSLDHCPDVDTVIFAVPHAAFRRIDPQDWLQGKRPYVLDANNVLSASQRKSFAACGCRLESVGRGPEWIEVKVEP